MLPNYIRCPHRKDGKHPRKGRLNKKECCVDCGEKYRHRRWMSHHRIAARIRAVSNSYERSTT